jgi:hypothetical protein
VPDDGLVARVEVGDELAVLVLRRVDHARADELAVVAHAAKPEDDRVHLEGLVAGEDDRVLVPGMLRVLEVVLDPVGAVEEGHVLRRRARREDRRGRPGGPRLEVAERRQIRHVAVAAAVDEVAARPEDVLGHALEDRVEQLRVLRADRQRLHEDAVGRLLEHVREHGRQEAVGELGLGHQRLAGEVAVLEHGALEVRTRRAAEQVDSPSSYTIIDCLFTCTLSKVTATTHGSTPAVLNVEMALMMVSFDIAPSVSTERSVYGVPA